MKLLLPKQVLDRLEAEMRKGRRIEIGGLLLGEHVGGDTFRLVDITVQQSGGSPVHFVRDPAEHQAQLDAFFAKTGADYTRFNYLGEWHTHPSFEPLPSGTDIATMQSIVENPAVNVNFLVLVIARLRRWKHIHLSAALFRSGLPPGPVELIPEGLDAERTLYVPKWLRRSLFMD